MVRLVLGIPIITGAPPKEGFEGWFLWFSVAEQPKHHGDFTRYRNGRTLMVGVYVRSFGSDFFVKRRNEWWSPSNVFKRNETRECVRAHLAKRTSRDDRWSVYLSLLRNN